jgi:hypothetical protein
MTTIQESGTAAQPPPTSAKAVADLSNAIRDAHTALNGPLDDAIARLREASRLAAEVNNPHAQELANLVGALEPAFETQKLVEMCVRDMLPKQ